MDTYIISYYVKAFGVITFLAGCTIPALAPLLVGIILYFIGKGISDEF